MELREFFSEDAIKLELEGETKDDILKELIALLKLDDKSEGMLYKMLKRRENLGSTGIGRGIAIPHCRSLVVSKLRVAFGRKPRGVDFRAIDEKPVNFFFLIVAPPLEVSNQYLPVLGKIAQLAKEPDVPARLAQLTSADDFLRLLGEKDRDGLPLIHIDWHISQAEVESGMRAFQLLRDVVQRQPKVCVEPA